MRRPTQLLLLVVAALLALAWWATDHADPPRSAPPTSQRTGPARRSARAAPPAPRRVEEASPDVAPELEALVVLADAAGEGVVRCVLPETPDEAAELLGVPGYHLDGRHLVFRTDLPSGTTGLDRAHADFGHTRAQYLAAIEPVAVLTWSGAGPGREASCHAEPPWEVTLAGTITGMEGAEGRDRTVRGCEGEYLPVDAQGRFEQHTWAGAPCSFSASGAVLDTDQHVMVDRNTDRDDLQLTFVPPYSSEQEFSDWYRPLLEARLAASLEPSAEERAVELALARDDLPDQVRELITLHVAELRRERARLRTRLEGQLAEEWH